MAFQGDLDKVALNVKKLNEDTIIKLDIVAAIAAESQASLESRLDVIANKIDESANSIINASNTGTTSSVVVTVENTVILAANSSRKGLTIYNESGKSCYFKLGTLSSLISYTLQIAVGGYYEIPFNYTGALSGITLLDTATLRVTELT